MRKIKIVFLLVLLIFASVFFFQSIKSVIDSKKSYQLLQKEMEELELNSKDLKTKLDDLHVQLSDKGMIIQNDNLSIAQSIHTLSGFTLLDITAQKASENECTDIVTVEDINDVTYFTEEIDYMQFRGKINNYNKFYKSVASSGLIINEIQLDYSKSIATLQLLTVTTEDLPANLEGLQGDSGKEGETVFNENISMDEITYPRDDSKE